MWKRDETPRSRIGLIEDPVENDAPPAESGRDRVVAAAAEGLVADIGKSVIIKGELTGSEDLTIEGQFEGRIELRENALTVGPHGRLKADVVAKSIDVFGRLVGTMTALDVATIRENGAVDGDITAPRIAIADGAHFRGNIDMRDGAADAPSARPGRVESKPVDGRKAGDPVRSAAKSITQRPRDDAPPAASASGASSPSPPGPAPGAPVRKPAPGVDRTAR